MPQYVFKCPTCNRVYQEYQKIDDVHFLQCDGCKTECVRVFTPPQVKKNQGFFSQTLGKEVHSQTEYKDDHEKWMYMHDLDSDLGNNRKPKDQWIEERQNVEQNKLDKVQKQSDVIEEENNKHNWYDSVETFKFEPER